MSYQSDPMPRRDLVAYGLVPAAAIAFHAITIAGYGIFRDELYYLACADHLDWGYVDHPPLSIAILAAVRAGFGDSLAVIRMPAILANALTVLLAASLARALGGAAMAQRLAAVSTATFPIGLALAGFFSMNAFDLAFWIGATRIVAAALRPGADARLWLWFGVVAGFGLQNKISVLFLGFGLFAGLVLARRFDLLRSRWTWLGGVIALALFLPHLVWQVVHGAPTLEFMENARRFKMAEMGALAFTGEVLLNAGPLLLPILFGGLGYLIFARSARAARPIGWAFVVVFAVMAATGAKPYYMAAALPLMFAAGGVAWERWLPQRGGVLLGLVAINFVVLAPFTKAILPVDVFVTYAQAIGLMPSSGERQAVGRLPQHFADQHGWEDLARLVAQVRNTLPEEERERACVFGQNYGHAGAIDYFGPRLGLPHAAAPHNSYWMWGPPCRSDVWIVIGEQRETLETIFATVELGEVFRCDACMPFEDGKTIWIGRGLREPIETVWPRLKRFV